MPNNPVHVVFPRGCVFESHRAEHQNVHDLMRVQPVVKCAALPVISAWPFFGKQELFWVS